MVGGVALSKSVAAAESVKPESQIPTVNAQSCAAYGPTTTLFFAKLQVCGAPRTPRKSQQHHVSMISELAILSDSREHRSDLRSGGGSACQKMTALLSTSSHVRAGPCSRLFSEQSVACYKAKHREDIERAGDIREICYYCNA